MLQKNSELEGRLRGAEDRRSAAEDASRRCIAELSTVLERREVGGLLSASVVVIIRTKMDLHERWRGVDARGVMLRHWADRGAVLYCTVLCVPFRLGRLGAST